jgi:hypothetical protein
MLVQQQDGRVLMVIDGSCPWDVYVEADSAHLFLLQLVQQCSDLVAFACCDAAMSTHELCFNSCCTDTSHEND